MDFRSLTVKDCFANPKCEAIIKQYAPQLMKYPIKLFNRKSCGEIFDLVDRDKNQRRSRRWFFAFRRPGP